MSKVLGKIKAILSKVLIILAIICLIAWGFNFQFDFLDMVIKGNMWLWAAIGSGVLAFVIDKETASRAVSSIGSSIGSLAGSIGSAAGSAVSGLVSGLAPIVPYVVIGFVGYKLITSDK